MHSDLSESTPDRRGMPGRRVYREASPTELIYIATRMIVVSRSSISGTIDKTQFEAAVGHPDGTVSLASRAAGSDRIRVCVGLDEEIPECLRADLRHSGRQHRIRGRVRHSCNDTGHLGRFRQKARGRY